MAELYQHAPLGHVQIKVIGVGNSGGKMLNDMIAQKISAAEFVSIGNKKMIEQSFAETKLQLGMEPPNEEDNYNRILNLLRDTDMVILVANMSNETEKNITTAIAKAANGLGILTITVITASLIRKSLTGAEIFDLKKFSDSLFVIPNISMIGSQNNSTHLTLKPSYRDNFVPALTVQAITDSMTQSAYLGYNFADIKSVLSKHDCESKIGIGIATGKNKAVMASKAAYSSLFLDDIDMHDAQAIVVNVTGGENIMLGDYDMVITTFRNRVNKHAEFLYGLIYDPNMAGEDIRVTVIAKV